MGDCVFCGIVQGKIPASVVYEDEDVISFLDTNPVQKGHTLIIPKKHFVDIWDIEPEILVKVTEVTGRVAHRMRTTMEVEGINTFSASGKPAGQEIYHFHMHVIPLAKGERTKFSREWWTATKRHVERSELDELAKTLRF